MADQSNLQKKKVIRILSMDGGGVRGVAIARILQEIETACKQPIHELFDVVIGTSTGGLISIMMGVPTTEGKIMSAEDAKNFYLHEGTTIFPPKSTIRKALDYSILLPLTLTKPKYDPKGLESVIRGHYGEKITLASAKTCIGVVASDMRYAESIVFNSMRAKLYPDDNRHNASIIKVGRATSAAPLFLPPISVGRHRKERTARRSITWNSTEAPEYMRGSIILEDGGTTHNNPAFLGMKLASAQLKANGYTDDEFQFQVISIGTGSETGTEVDPTLADKGWKKQSADGGFDNVVRRVFLDDVFGMKAKEWRAHLKVKASLGNKEGAEPGSNYYRVQFKLKKDQLGHMDNSKRDHMDGLVESAEGYLFEEDSEKYSTSFQNLVDFIKQDCERPIWKDLRPQQPLQAAKISTESTQAERSESESTITDEKIADLVLLTSLKLTARKFRSKAAV